jgi:HAD superfamily hydrolase (TIGR01509 family)
MRALKHAYETTGGGWVDPEALWRSHRGGSLEGLGERLLGADARKFTVAYRECYYSEPSRCRPYPGVPEAIERLASAGLPLAVVTSKISWGATGELEATDLLRYFAAVVGGDDVERAKPDPEPIYMAMERLLIDDPAEVVFVGDSPADMFAARNAGCVGVAALWGTLDAEMLMDAGPAHTAADPEAALRAIETVSGLRL